MTSPVPELSPRVRASRWDWIIVAVGLLVATAAFAHRGQPEGVGSRVNVEITLVPRDARGLSCASDRAYSNLRCAFTANGAGPTGTDRPIVPVVSVRRELFFAAGLFQDPSVAEHLKGAARPDERFVAACRLRLVEHVTDLRVRFWENVAFARAEPAWVADVISCRVELPRPH